MDQQKLDLILLSLSEIKDNLDSKLRFHWKIIIYAWISLVALGGALYGHLLGKV